MTGPQKKQTQKHRTLWRYDWKTIGDGDLFNFCWGWLEVPEIYCSQNKGKQTFYLGMGTNCFLEQQLVYRKKCQQLIFQKWQTGLWKVFLRQEIATWELLCFAFFVETTWNRPPCWDEIVCWSVYVYTQNLASVWRRSIQVGICMNRLSAWDRNFLSWYVAFFQKVCFVLYDWK